MFKVIGGVRDVSHVRDDGRGVSHVQGDGRGAQWRIQHRAYPAYAPSFFVK